jgi:Holliday junction resolvasome RuvABC endonuclease subunit
VGKYIKVIGADLSLNHGGIVELTNGHLSNFFYYTDFAGSAGKSKKRGFRMPTWTKEKDRQKRQMLRLSWIETFLREKIFKKGKNVYVGIEDYALDAKHGSHYQGEVGGIARLICWDLGLKMRLHDPISLKMFATHKGTSDKDMVEAAVVKRWLYDFDSLNQPPSKPTKKNPNPKPNRQTSQDLCDAVALAYLVWTEILLRKGEMKLKDMHEKEVRVFNRVTKAYPVSLLDREWIAKNEDE